MYGLFARYGHKLVSAHSTVLILCEHTEQAAKMCGSYGLLLISLISFLHCCCEYFCVSIYVSHQIGHWAGLWAGHLAVVTHGRAAPTCHLDLCNSSAACSIQSMNAAWPIISTASYGNFQMAFIHTSVFVPASRSFTSNYS